LLLTDLDGAGRQSAIACTADEVVALEEDGHVRWRTKLPEPITHVSCHDLDGDGRHCICLGLLGGELRILSPEGELRQAIPLPELVRRSGDIFYGLMHAANGLAVWQRQPDGRAALAVGGYSLVVFLGPDGEMLGHSWADGSWQTDLLAVPQAQPQGAQLWVRNPWNHGICIYQGKAGFDPSGEVVSFGGVRQPMFRGLRGVIPFVTGPTVAFGWIEGSESQGGRVLAAAETGVGVLSVPTQEWLWRNEGGVPIRACIAVGGDGPGQAAVVTGGADGFVASFAREDGRPLRRLHVGAPVTGLCQWPAANLLVVATTHSLLVLDYGWRVRASYPVAARRLCSWGEGEALVLRPDSGLELLKYG
jgi:hypothetical protein